MELIVSSLGALAVAMIFYAYRSYLQDRYLRERTLHDRIAYMLWVMAEGGES